MLPYRIENARQALYNLEQVKRALIQIPNESPPVKTSGYFERHNRLLAIAGFVQGNLPSIDEAVLTHHYGFYDPGLALKITLDQAYRHLQAGANLETNEVLEQSEKIFENPSVLVTRRLDEKVYRPFRIPNIYGLPEGFKGHSDEAHFDDGLIEILERRGQQSPKLPIELTDLRLIDHLTQILQSAYTGRNLSFHRLQSAPHARDIMLYSLNELKNLWIQNFSYEDLPVDEYTSRVLIQTIRGLFYYDEEKEIESQKDPEKKGVPLILPMPRILRVRR
jgi:hypothetical protein